MPLNATIILLEVNYKLQTTNYKEASNFKLQIPNFYSLI